MSRHLHGTIGAALLCLVSLSSAPQIESAATKPGKAQALGLIVYPGRDQTPAQQSTDEQQCHDWAKTQAGIGLETFKKAMGTCLQGRGYTTG